MLLNDSKLRPKIQLCSSSTFWASGRLRMCLEMIACLGPLNSIVCPRCQSQLLSTHRGEEVSSIDTTMSIRILITRDRPIGSGITCKWHMQLHNFKAKVPFMLQDTTCSFYQYFRIVIVCKCIASRYQIYYS